MKCPTCGKPTNWQENPFRPFCSERCKLVDFGRWVNEEYSVPDERPSEQKDVPAYSPESDGDV